MTIRILDDYRAVSDRLQTIADEAFGPFPTEPAQKLLTIIEHGIAMQRRAIDTEDLVNNRLLSAARALLDALPRCLDPDCGEMATRGVLSHEPDACEVHTAQLSKVVRSKRADWADEAEELRKAVEG
jgi:hypothetical protein